jgi:hypothetical protein
MGFNVYRFFLGGVLLFALSGRLTADDMSDAMAARMQILDDSADGKKAALLIEDAMTAYQRNDFARALKLMENAAAVFPDDKELAALVNSLRRIARLKQEEIGSGASESTVGSGRSRERLDWGLDDLEYIDKNRYLFALWFLGELPLITVGGTETLRTAATLKAEGFLPVLDRRLGLELGVTSVFANLDHAQIARDYIYWQYRAAIQYRISWNLPALEQQVTLAVKVGVLGQEVVERTAGSFPQVSLKRYIIPYIEASIQDAVLYHIWQNTFTENFILKPSISIGFRPRVGDDDDSAATVFDVGIGIYYRIRAFLIGANYHFNYHVSQTDSAVARNSSWGIALSYQF